jgi:Clathrin light chain
MNLKLSGIAFGVYSNVDNGAKKGTCKSNAEKKSRKRRNKKSSNKQNKQSTTFTTTTTIPKKKQSHRQGNGASTHLMARKEEAEYHASRDESAGGTAWERIAKYVDISEKGTAGSGPTRYRDLLLSLKRDANAPGASA